MSRQVANGTGRSGGAPPPMPYPPKDDPNQRSIRNPAFADKVKKIIVDRGRITVHEGGFASYLEEKARRDNDALARGGNDTK